jgi:RNA polymerase sigma-70 factor (ECF subfamily)
MELYVAGQLEAFDALYGQVAPRLFAYLLQLTKDRARAEDLLQVTFSKIHRARDSYLAGSPLMPWVLAIARRSFYDETRARRARPEELSAEGILPEPKVISTESNEDLVEALSNALAELPETYREAIQLTRISGLSIAEAANVTGTSVSAMKLRIHRGYHVLRDLLGKVYSND